MDLLLKDKVIIVTGGNSGIGKSIVEVVARLGARVVIDYRSHPEATQAIEQEIGELGGTCFGVQADVGKLDDLQRLVQEAGLGLAPGQAFHDSRDPSMQGWLRWCFASADLKRLGQGVDRLARWMAL